MVPVIIFDLQTFTCPSRFDSKMYQSKQVNAPTVEIWGTGKALREFLFVDDLADAALFLMHHYNDSLPLNVGVGQDISIADVAHIIKEIVGFKGDLVFNTSKPDGTPRKLLNVEKIHALGWKAQTSLEDGIRKTLEWYSSNIFLTKNVICKQKFI